MSAVTIKKISTRRELKAFIRFNYELYKDCPYAVPDFLEDTLDTFNPQKNAAFDFCDVDYFLALREGKIVGRVAAIINHKANQTWGTNNARFGWIDFTDDPEVSRALMDTVEAWGRAHGCDKLVGPLGFTDMDPEGMLTGGYDYPAVDGQIRLLGVTMAEAMADALAEGKLEAVDYGGRVRVIGSGDDTLISTDPMMVILFLAVMVLATAGLRLRRKMEFRRK